MRTDPGTENSIVAVIQPVLRHIGSDSFAGCNSHRYGKSPSNQVSKSQMTIVYGYHLYTNIIIQRIEAFWSQLRKSVTDWWIQFFKEFQRDGHFNSTTFYHMYEVTTITI